MEDTERKTWSGKLAVLEPRDSGCLYPEKDPLELIHVSHAAWISVSTNRLCVAICLSVWFPQQMGNCVPGTSTILAALFFLGS